MALGCYSDAEKIFILHGVEVNPLKLLFEKKFHILTVHDCSSQVNFRYDGRTRSEYRPMEVETDIVPHASGSARLRLANTDILIGVKAEIDKPAVDSPNEGKLEFFVDW